MDIFEIIEQNKEISNESAFRFDNLPSRIWVKIAMFFNRMKEDKLDTAMRLVHDRGFGIKDVNKLKDERAVFHYNKKTFIALDKFNKRLITVNPGPHAESIEGVYASYVKNEKTNEESDDIKLTVLHLMGLYKTINTNDVISVLKHKDSLKLVDKTKLIKSCEDILRYLNPVEFNVNSNDDVRRYVDEIKAPIYSWAFTRYIIGIRDSIKEVINKHKVEELNEYLEYVDKVAYKVEEFLTTVVDDLRKVN